MPRKRKDVLEIIGRLNEHSPRASFVVKDEATVEDWKQAFEKTGFVCTPFQEGRRVGYECSNGRSPPQLRSVKVARWVQSRSEKAATGGETEATQEAEAAEAVEKEAVPTSRD